MNDYIMKQATLVSLLAVGPALGWNQTAWVDLSQTTGPPTHLASGFINGIRECS